MSVAKYKSGLIIFLDFYLFNSVNSKNTNYKIIGKYIKELQPQVPLFMIERTPDGNPAKMIDFTNEKAVLWKVEKIIGKMPAKK